MKRGLLKNNNIMMNHYHEPSSYACFSIPSAIRGLRVKPEMTMDRGLRVKPAMTIEKKMQKNFLFEKYFFPLQPHLYTKQHDHCC